MEMKILVTLLFCLCNAWFTFPYDVQSLKKDISTVDLNELLEYRGMLTI